MTASPLSSLELKVHEIREQGGLLIETRLPAEEFLSEFSEEIRPADSIDLHAEFLLGENHILLQAKVQTQLDLSCCRCLERFREDLNAEWENTFAFVPATIDLKEEIRQA